MRSTTSILVLLVFMSASHTRVFAQPQRDLAPSCVHHVWTAEDGLPVNSATSILQSKDGYLWIGTWQGLVRFDGADFLVYDSREIDGLESSRITSLYEDRDGAIWIGNTNGGLARLRDGRFTTHTTEAGLGGDYVMDIHEGRPGERLLRSVVSTIETNLSSELFSAEELAAILGMSPRQLRRRLANTLSESPSRLIQHMRMEQAAQLLEADAGTVAEVAQAVGFSDASYFATAFKKYFGHAPSEHAEQHRGDEHEPNMTGI